MAAKRGKGVLRKDGQPRESNTGTTKPVVDDSNWRVKVVARHRIKFDDKAKQRYLDKLAETGRRWAAEDAAGVARTTVDAHKKNDPDFAAACDEAAENYATRGLMKIEAEALDGQEIQRFDPETGALVQTERRFETRLREMFLKRHDPGYNEKAHIEVTGKVGVVFAPPLASMDDWKRMAEAHDQVSAAAQNPDAADTASAVH
jgi:hypothetical protein